MTPCIFYKEFISSTKNIVFLYFIIQEKRKEDFIMSHRIEYLTIDGGTVIEYTDEKGYARLENDAQMGYIVITSISRYER